MRHSFFLLLPLICSGHLLAQTSCTNPDVNCDGAVTTNDLLGLLGYFGDVDADGDGIWDSEDECVFCVQTCGVVSYQGYDYQTTVIGDQCWFAENLRCEYYLNGDTIPKNLIQSEWQMCPPGSGAVSIYGEGNGPCQSSTPDGDACDEAWSLEQYGRLYNGFAVTDERGLCPSGWHVPSNTEFIMLHEFLGGWTAPTGFKVKSQNGWFGGANGDNSSGFSALPAGARTSPICPYGGGIILNPSDFTNAGLTARFWTDDQVCDNPGGEVLLHARALSWDSDDFSPACMNIGTGASVRCIKDTQ